MTGDLIRGGAALVAAARERPAQLSDAQLRAATARQLRLARLAQAGGFVGAALTTFVLLRRAVR